MKNKTKKTAKQHCEDKINEFCAMLHDVKMPKLKKNGTRNVSIILNIPKNWKVDVLQKTLSDFVNSNRFVSTYEKNLKQSKLERKYKGREYLLDERFMSVEKLDFSEFRNRHISSFTDNELRKKFYDYVVLHKNDTNLLGHSIIVTLRDLEYEGVGSNVDIGRTSHISRKNIISIDNPKIESIKRAMKRGIEKQKRRRHPVLFVKDFNAIVSCIGTRKYTIPMRHAGELNNRSRYLDFEDWSKKYNAKISKGIELQYIYILYKDNDIVYIGKTNKLRNRLLQHHKVKDFDSFFYYFVEKNNILDVEKYLIKRYTPKYNIAHNSDNALFFRQVIKSIASLQKFNFTDYDTVQYLFRKKYDIKSLKIWNKDTVCVYALFKKKKIVYIGSTKNLGVRLYQHENEGEKDFDKVSYFNNVDWDSFGGDEIKMIRKLEASFIQILRPKYNITHNLTT